MRAALLLAAMAMTVSACAGSYGLPDGDASYDAIKSATDDCKAKGGVIEPRSEGDNRMLSNYQCKIGGKK